MIPQEYAPQEDRGQFNGKMQAPEGTSYERLAEQAMKVEHYLQPYFDNGTVQRGIVERTRMGRQPIRHRERHAEALGRALDQHTRTCWHVLNKNWEEIPDLRVTAFMSSGQRGGGGGGGGGGQPVQLVLGGPNYERACALARHHHRAGLGEPRAGETRLGSARNAAASARTRRHGPGGEPRRHARAASAAPCRR